MSWCTEDDCPVEELEEALNWLVAYMIEINPERYCIKAGLDECCEYKNPTRDECIKCMNYYVWKKARDIVAEKRVKECVGQWHGV